MVLYTPSESELAYWLAESLNYTSGKVRDIILHSWSAGTKEQYKSYLKRWFEFCAEQQADPYNLSVIIVLDFLVQPYGQG